MKNFQKISISNLLDLTPNYSLILSAYTKCMQLQYEAVHRAYYNKVKTLLSKSNLIWVRHVTPVLQTYPGGLD